MNWNTHSEVKGTHAFLSPSRPHWVNYPPEKLALAYKNHRQTLLGTQYHELAERCINLAVRLPNTSATINAFVNDAIGFKMSPEVILFYSQNAFGTADAISFSEDTKILRIHDLKTGVVPGKMQQVDIYAALFCLEYKIKPENIVIILRIYQNDELVEWSPETESIEYIMRTIVEYDRLIQEINEVGL